MVGQPKFKKRVNILPAVSVCGSNIRFVDTITEFCLSVLQFKKGSFQLVDEAPQADILLILCDSCRHYADDLGSIGSYLRSSIDPPINSVSTCKSGLDDADKLETCDGCGAVIDITDILYSLDRTIGVIALNSYFQIGDLTATDSVEFSSYCQGCGSVIDSNHLQALLLDWIHNRQAGGAK